MHSLDLLTLASILLASKLLKTRNPIEFIILGMVLLKVKTIAKIKTSNAPVLNSDFVDFHMPSITTCQVHRSGAWWCSPLVPALQRQRLAGFCELEASLVYTRSSGIARAP